MEENAPLRSLKGVGDKTEKLFQKLARKKTSHFPFIIPFGTDMNLLTRMPIHTNIFSS